MCLHSYLFWSSCLGVNLGHRAPVLSLLICSQLATSWTQHCSMLPYQKKHCSSSHQPIISLPLPLLLSGTWVGRCFSHFSLPSSTTEKAARVQQLHLIPDKDSLSSSKKWTSQWHHSCLCYLLFLMSARELVKYLKRLRIALLWTCRRTVQNIPSPSVCRLALERITPPPITLGPLWALVRGVCWFPLIIGLYQRLHWESMSLMTINACSPEFWLWMFSYSSPSTWGRHSDS